MMSTCVWLLQAIKPVTPKATQAPPAAGSPQHGLWSVLPAGVLAKRFQRLFRGRGPPGTISQKFAAELILYQ
jgi:hypothetical protein